MTKKTKKKLPLKKVLKFTIRPEQGFAGMAASMDPPKGYVFSSMKRTNTRATITYVRSNP